MSVRIDEVIDRLQRAWATTGLEPPPGPKDSIEQVLADIASVIAPRRLPDEVVTFWRRLAPEHFSDLSPFPGLTSPEFALHCWLEHERDERQTPALLFPIAYRSRCFTFVELAQDDDPGGTLFSWCYGDRELRMTHAGLSSYLDQFATMIELGEYVAETLPDGREWHEFDPLEQWPQIAAVRLAPSLPLPRYGTRVTIGSAIREWPEHWLLAGGLTEASRPVTGPDTTIAELLRAAAGGVESHGTIHAEISRSAGTAAGRRLTIHDRTGHLDVWCPSAVTARIDGARLLEFEVVLHPRPSGDLSCSQEAGADLYSVLFDSPADAVATAARPVA